MEIDPTLVRAGLLLTGALAFVTAPLAACIFFSALAVLWFNPHPVPGDFFLEHGLAMRLNSPALISIPLFGLAGELAVFAGISERLLNLADAMSGRGRRSVGARTVLGCTLFASISGVGPAAVAAEGKRLAPAMLSGGYPKKFAAGAIACAAALSIIIPASVPLTVYAATIGVLTNIVFAASFIPGLVIAAALFLTMYVYSRFGGMGREPAHPVMTLLPALFQARWAVLLPVMVLAFLFTGFLTAPEAAAFSCAYSLLVARLHGIRFGGRELIDIFGRAATGAAVILILTATSGLFVMLANLSGLSESAADLVYGGVGGRVGSILFMNALLLAAGCVLDMPAIITLIAPLLLPLAERCDMSLPHFGVMVVVNIAIGLVTPPQAWNLAAASAAVGIHPREAARGAVPFLAVMLAVLLLVSFMPELSLWFPRLMGWPV